MKNYLLPQEFEVWHIIPAVRKEFARNLTEMGYTYQKTGELLGVTKPAISQYLHDQRGNSYLLSKEIRLEIEKSADKIKKDNSVIVKEFKRILDKIEKKEKKK